MGLGLSAMEERVRNLSGAMMVSSQNGFRILITLPHMLEAQKRQDPFGQLSERELEVVKLLADGLSNREIACQLYLSEGTVRNHVSGLLQKLQLRDRTQLAVAYHKRTQS